MFVESGPNKPLLKNLVVECSNKKDNKNKHKSNIQNRDYTNLKKLPWIPIISPKIKREYKKIGKVLPPRRGKSTANSLSKE